MSFLLIYIEQGEQFDRSWFVRFLEHCDGVQDIKIDSMVGALVSATFNYLNDSTIVELKKDRETIALAGIGKASIELARRIQTAFDKPLHIIDENCTFDFLIRNFPTREQLDQEINQALSASS